ncbi:hypothetical protein GTW25_19775 [Aliihoeflea aestuarii]|uniref:hypothetical protein n=1 Tax=Aliihoeflea aestuarii TaxID=453840 RepID=UPI0020950C9A|nr:hypothetical protein [Aliihoeflea aestuarii]MCO6393262.1 hypothetical protein [Aliihoeflea aestuarii]
MGLSRDGENNWLLKGDGGPLEDVLTAVDDTGAQTIHYQGRKYQILALGRAERTDPADMLAKGGPLRRGDLGD